MLRKGKEVISNKFKRPFFSDKFKTRITPWLFVLPAILMTLMLRYYTMIQSFIWAFFKYDIINPPGKFVGLDNFTYLLSSSSFWNSLMNTLIFLLFTFLLTFWVPILQALLLSEVKIGKNLFSTLYIIPAIIPGTVTIIIWKWIWNPQYGIANALFAFLKLPQQQWLSDPNLVKFSIIFPGILGGDCMFYYTFQQYLVYQKMLLKHLKLMAVMCFKPCVILQFPILHF